MYCVSSDVFEFQQSFVSKNAAKSSFPCRRKMNEIAKRLKLKFAEMLLFKLLGR